LPEEFDGPLDLRAVGTLDEARHHVAGDGATTGEGKDQVRDDRSETDHFGEHGLFDGSTCRMMGGLDHDVATPFAQRLLAGFGQELETGELGFRDLETDASDS
jgi:hypothetical protein